MMTLWNKTKDWTYLNQRRTKLFYQTYQTSEDNDPRDSGIRQDRTKIPEQKFTNYRKRLTSEEEYHQRVEQRIDDLITRLENKEIKLETCPMRINKL
jgi:septin family protein